MALVGSGHGVVALADARRRVSPSALRHSVRRGELVRVLPSVYVVAGLDDDPATLRRAALAYAGPASVLSHLSALQAWEMPVPAGLPDHVTVPTSCRPRAVEPVRFHRSQRLSPQNRDVVERAGLPTVRLERAIVESWPLLRDDARRATAIVAFQRRMTTPARLRRALGELPKLPDRRSLHELVDLLEQGCRSMLEIWGYLEVFQHPALPPSRGQVPIQIGGRTVYLDRLFEAELVNVELDGRKYHSSLQDRERDLRRDAMLSARGLLVARFSHDRIVHEPEQVVAELLEILAVRRRQFGAPGTAGADRWAS